MSDLRVNNVRRAAINEDAVRGFGFEEADDSWLAQLRQAEAPVPYGPLGPYTLMEEVSRGGQGVVFRAVQPGTQRCIALKRLLAGRFASATARRRFEREIEALATFRHPNIVAIFSMDVVEGAPLLAMEWIDGTPITEWARRGGRERAAPDVVALFVRVCRALQHAHQHGVIHRDLKPSNILVDTEDQPHVLDFGLAKFIRPEETVSAETEHFAGTLRYAAPEQLQGRPGEMDARTDVYAVGVLLYEALAGAPPYPFDGGLSSAVAAIERAEPIPLRQLAPGVDGDLEAVVAKALRKKPIDRYPSMDALAADLEAVLQGAPVTARRPGTVEQLRRFVRRHRVATAVLTTVLLALLALAGVSSFAALRIAQQRDVALAARDDAAAAEQRAQAAASRAEATAAFMQSVLVQADPLSSEALPAHDTDTTVRELLRHAAERVGRELPPSLQPETRLVVGRAYLNMGLLPEGVEQLEAGLQTLESAAEEHPQTRLALLCGLYDAAHSLGDAARAARYGDAAVALYRSSLADGIPPPQIDVSGPAMHLYMTGNRDAAERLYRDALDAHRAAFGDHSLVADELRSFASLLGMMAQHEEAAALAREAIVMRRRLGDAHETALAADYVTLAEVLRKSGRPAEAEEMYLRGLEIRERRLGWAHSATALVLYQYGGFLLEVGRPVEAAASLERALAGFVAVDGADCVNAGSTRWRLGQAAAALEDWPTAEAQLRTAQDILKPHLPPEHGLLARVSCDLGGILLAQGDLPEAEAMLLDAWNATEARFPPTHRWRVAIARQLVEVYETAGDEEAAAVWRSRVPAASEDDATADAVSRGAAK